MKSKIDLNPTFPAGSRRRPTRWLVGPVVVVACGLAPRGGPIPMRSPGQVPVAIAPLPAGWIVNPWGTLIPRAVPTPPRDRFVIVAPPEIDPAMVVHARDDIDPEMVFHPETGRRGLASGRFAPSPWNPRPR